MRTTPRHLFIALVSILSWSVAAAEDAEVRAQPEAPSPDKARASIKAAPSKSAVGGQGRKAPASPKALTPPPPGKGTKKRAQEPWLKYSFELTPRYFVGVNDINHTALHPESGERSFSHYLAPIVDSDYASLYLFAGLQFPYRFSHHSGSAHVEFDTGEIYRGSVTTTDETSGASTEEEAFLSNEQTLWDELEQTYFIRQLYLEHSFGAGKHLNIAIGRGNPVIAQGLVYNDYSPFARVRLSSGKAWTHPLQLDLTLVAPSDGFVPEESVIGNLELALKHKSLGRLSLFFAHLKDRADSAAESFRQVITSAVQTGGRAERSLVSGRMFAFNRLTTFSSTSDVSWVGAGYSKYWASGHSVWMNGCLNFGTAEVVMDVSGFLVAAGRGRNRPRRDSSGNIEVDLDVNGAAGQAGGSLFLRGDWYLSGFAVAMTGDEGLSGLRDFFQSGLENGEVSERFGAFMSVVPYLEHTSIFFNGGLDQGFSNRRNALAGIAGRGVLAAGLSVSGTIWGPVSFVGGPALLQAMHEGPHGLGKLYGVELDHILTVTLGTGLSASLEVDLLHTGDFFPESAWNSQTTVQISYAPTGQL